MGKDNKKVKLLLIWHMHQPDYYDPEAQEIALPWVRLHGCLGYADMAMYLLEHPGVRVTINFSGVLLSSLYASSKDDRILEDKYYKLSLKRPSDLFYEEKIYILKHFFSIAPEKIKKCPRMLELLQIRGRNISQSLISDIYKKFSEQDFLDLQVLFNLLWMGTNARKKFEIVRELIKKGSNYTNQEKEELLKVQKEIVRNVLSSYMILLSRGQIEISFTPYYHPILPLLLDSSCAQEGLAGVLLPERFSFPDDAKWHVEKSMLEYERIFGKKPIGMWPAEGGVSEEVISLANELGVKWVGTDEGILWNSLRRSLLGSGDRESLLYKPYKVNDIPVSIFFRDHYLSDRIGFSYQSMKTEDAMNDFLSYISKISQVKMEDFPVVTVILDGENPWPYYPDDGGDFLPAFYDKLEHEEWLETMTPSDILKEEMEISSGRLNYLFPGSWIDSNFRIWIGDNAKNRAWKLLATSRRLVMESQCSEEERKRALDNLMVAEGSDWFWWYGEPNSSTEDPIFDSLFRTRLRESLRIAKAQIPVALLEPPMTQSKPAPVVKSPLTFIHPGINGSGEKYFEWYNAGRYVIQQKGGEMTKNIPLFGVLFYGFDYDFIYLRLDPLGTPEMTMNERLADVSVRIVFKGDFERWVEVFLSSSLQSQIHGALHSEKCQIAFKRVLEIAIPIKLFEFPRGSFLCFFILIFKKGTLVERYPEEGFLEITVPDDKWDKQRWIV